MISFKRGDIALVIFPNSDLKTGKKRPVLIVGSDSGNTGLPQRIVAMVSSNMKRAGHPSRVQIQLSSEEGKNSGLLLDSVIMPDNLATIRTHEFDKVIGHISGMAAVDSALRHTLALG
jgi:mRNA interferase MazF